MSYASDVYSDVQALSNDPAVLSDLSPAARATLGIVRFSIDQSLQGKSPADIAAALADQAIGAGLVAGQQLLAQIASTISSDLGAAAGAVIPYVGWIVQMLLNAKPAGNQASVALYTQGASEVYEPIGQVGHAPGFGTGPGGAIMPVDLFVKGEGKPNAQGRTFTYTSMGMCLAAITEYDGMMDKVHAKLGAKVGIPAARRSQFRALRRRIVDSYNRLSDGGAALWTIYLDLLRHEFDCGHLTPTYARYLSVWRGAWNRWQGNAPRDGSIGQPLEQWEYDDLYAPVTYKLLTEGIAKAQTCAVDKHAGEWTFPELYDTRPRQQVYDTTQGWRQTLTPKYVQFQSLEAKVLAYMKAHGKSKIVLDLPPSPKIVLTLPTKASVAAAAAKPAQKAQQKSIAASAAKWTATAGPLPAEPHTLVPRATIPVPNATAPVMTVVPGLSFQPKIMAEASAPVSSGGGAAIAGLGALLLFL